VESLTKRRLTDAELAATTAHCFAVEVADATELVDGTYNAAYRVILADGRDLVLKVAPTPGRQLLTHEVDLMRTEADFYTRAAPTGAPVPRIHAVDFDRQVLDTDYMFLERFQGTPLHQVPDTPVRRELGRIAAQVQTATGPAYGYPLRGSRTWQPTWRAAFLAMVDDILDDARRLGTELPASPDRIGALVGRHADLLDAVRRPALVHYDLWDGNVIVRDGRVEGIIDGERAFFGDPLAELVSLALFRDVEDCPDLLAGYAEQTGVPVELTPDGRRRITLYTVYLYLIMVTEGPTRGYDTPRHHEFRRRILGLLDTLLATLERGVG